VLVGSEGKKKARRAVGKLVDSLTCELQGIVLSLEMLLQAFTNACDMNLSREAFLVCDCSAAIDMILHRESYGRISRQMFRILQLAKSLKDIQVIVHLAWVPSHCGIVANEEVDKLAKIAAEDAFHDRILASSVISLSAAFKVSSEIAQESWQAKWDQEPAVFFTRLLIPEVNTKVLFPRNYDAGISYCRLLLNDTMLREDSFRTGVSDTPMCKCGMEHESAEHFLFRCAEHHSARSVMIRGGTGREFRRIPDPGTRPLLPGRIRVVAGSGYLI